MSKELESLKDIERVCKDSSYYYDYYKERLNIIETALKDLLWYQEQLNDFDIKENQLRETFIVYKNYQTDKESKRRLDLIGEVLVDVSKGNYADVNDAINEIREILEDLN